jgi:50S ribosomal subunit-associated GTPase HflX
VARELGALPPTLLLCNKSDCASRVADAELTALCAQHALRGWLRVSAKTGDRVHEAFQRLAELVETEQIEAAIEQDLALALAPTAPRRRWCW